MQKTLVGAAVAAIVGATAVHAAAPADQDACNKLAFSLAKKAAGKKLAKDTAEKVDAQIVKLEGECAGSKLAEAEATARDIEAAIGK